MSSHSPSGKTRAGGASISGLLRACILAEDLPGQAALPDMTRPRYSDVSTTRNDVVRNSDGSWIIDEQNLSNMNNLVL